MLSNNNKELFRHTPEIFFSLIFLSALHYNASTSQHENNL